MNKKQLSERDICTKYITPALEKTGCDDLAGGIRYEQEDKDRQGSLHRPLLGG